MSKKSVLSLFEGFGIELEYMIVDSETLMPSFICDKVLEDLAGEKTMSIEDGEVAWSNELALHVIEVKSNGPKKDLPKLHQNLLTSIRKMAKHLEKFNAILLPSAMHPFFDPEDGSLKLWEDEDAEIYAAYNRIFDCRGHGWGNLQSIHINLPFNGDEEFGRLHSAIRLVVPLLPALAASSPYVEGKLGPLLDSRLDFYLKNQRRIPTIIGDAIPEPVSSKAEYQKVILDPMYRDIAKFDTDNLLQNEWLNSRTAIARFDRNAIEIRILDIQECLTQDFALITGITNAIKHLCEMGNTKDQLNITQSTLIEILHGSLKSQTNYAIPDPQYVKLLQGDHTTESICKKWIANDSPYFSAFKELTQGRCLAKRLVENCGEKPSRETLVREYRKLSQCLLDDKMYGI